MNKLGISGALLIVGLALAACGKNGDHGENPETAARPSTTEASQGSARTAWDALTPQEQESACSMSHGVSAESAAEIMEFYEKQARPRTFDTSTEAHADRVALMKYAKEHCN